MKHQLADLLDIPRLQSALDSLYLSSKIPSAIIDNEGNIHTGSGWQDICVKFHRLHPEARKRCLDSDLYISRHLREANPSVVYKCPHGLVDSATAIFVEENTSGTCSRANSSWKRRTWISFGPRERRTVSMRMNISMR
ncbi:PocR ligand-binding domain-containing protein [bacterium]|nr:PocR ligand-binding domain-containing protein [bacterium]